MAETLMRITRDDGYERRWVVVGPKGAVDFHCTHGPVDHPIVGRIGGVEYHYRTPPDYMRSEAAHHPCCWALDGPCWSDGSSLQATEHWIPMLERAGEDAIWAELERAYHAHDWPMPTEAEVSRG